MGYIRHHAIIVTDHGYGEHINEAHTKAVEMGCNPSAVIRSAINNYHSFFIPPDGSKEGWGESSLGDMRRGKFIAWIDEQRYGDGSSPFSWVEVQYGDDNRETVVISHNDEYIRRKPGALK